MCRCLPPFLQFRFVIENRFLSWRWVPRLTGRLRFIFSSSSPNPQSSSTARRQQVTNHQYNLFKNWTPHLRRRDLFWSLSKKFTRVLQARDRSTWTRIPDPRSLTFSLLLQSRAPTLDLHIHDNKSRTPPQHRKTMAPNNSSPASTPAEGDWRTVFNIARPLVLRTYNVELLAKLKDLYYKCFWRLDVYRKDTAACQVWARGYLDRKRSELREKIDAARRGKDVKKETQVQQSHPFPNNPSPNSSTRPTDIQRRPYHSHTFTSRSGYVHTVRGPDEHASDQPFRAIEQKFGQNWWFDERGRYHEEPLEQRRSTWEHREVGVRNAGLVLRTDLARSRPHGEDSEDEEDGD